MDNFNIIDRTAYEERINIVINKIKNESGSIKIEGLPSTGKSTLLKTVAEIINASVVDKICCLVDINVVDDETTFWDAIQNQLISICSISPTMEIKSFIDVQRFADDLKKNKGTELILIFDNIDLLCLTDLHTEYDRTFFNKFKGYINRNYRVIISYSHDLWDLFVKHNLSVPGQESPFVYQIDAKITLTSLSEELSKKIIRMGIDSDNQEDINFLFEFSGSFFPILKQMIMKWNEIKSTGSNPRTFFNNLLSSGIEIQKYYDLKNCLECFSEIEKNEIKKIANGTIIPFTEDYRGLVINADGNSKVNGKILLIVLREEYPLSRSSGNIQNKSPETFNWLHFSDFHWPKNDADFYWDTILNAMIDDLQKIKIKSKIENIDAVFFTGDLVKDGKGFDDAHKAFFKLQQSIMDIFQSKPYFFPVPGNHDVYRPQEPYDAGALCFMELWNHAHVHESIWKKRSDSTYFKTINELFKNYSQWSDFALFPKPDRFKSGLLPGEFSGIIKKGDKQIGIVGLNSAFLQLKNGNYYGKLDTHISQLREMQIETDWFVNNTINILLTHHAPNWYCSSGKDQYFSEINPNFRFQFHLCGHEHEGSFTQQGMLDDSANNLIIAQSLFGMKEFEVYDGSGNTKCEVRNHGYILTSIDLAHLKFRSWHRTATKGKNTPWEFCAAQRPKHLNDGGTSKRSIVT